MSNKNPKVGDHLTVFIDRKSRGGNLICRKSNRFHVVESNSDGQSPDPHERWKVEVINESHGIFGLKPLEQLDTYPRDAPKVKEGDGTNPFK
jgi:hypothetical protein